MIKHYQTLPIQTERLILKKGTIDDFIAVHEYDLTKLRDIDGEFEYKKMNPEVIKTWFQLDIEQVQANNESAHIFDWIIYLKKDMTQAIPIGDMIADRENIENIGDIENENKEIEIAFNLHPDYWGNGYMPEAINAVLDYLFELGYDNIKSGYSDGNVKSKRVLEKTGFEHYKIEKNAWQKNGKPIDDYKVVINRPVLKPVGADGNPPEVTGRLPSSPTKNTEFQDTSNKNKWINGGINKHE